MRRILGRYLALLTGNTQVSGVNLDDLSVPHEPETLSMAVGALLTIPNDQKQDLIEMTSTAARLSY